MAPRVGAAAFHTEFTLPGSQAVNALLQILAVMLPSEIHKHSSLQALSYIHSISQSKIRVNLCQHHWETVCHTPHSLSDTHTLIHSLSLSVWLPINKSIRLWVVTWPLVCERNTVSVEDVTNIFQREEILCYTPTLTWHCVTYVSINYDQTQSLSDHFFNCCLMSETAL